MTDINRQVGAYTDDCYTFQTTMRLNREYLFIDDCNLEMHAYMRFLDIAIPKGATIEHAHLEVCSYGSNGGRSEMVACGIKEPSTNTFSSQPDADGRPITTASEDWICGAGGFEDYWDADSWHGYPDGPELKGIIQEIVNQSGWLSGAPLAIKIVNTPVGGQGRLVWAWDYNPSLAAKLYITYGEAGAYYHGLKVQGEGELALCDAGNHPLRIRKGGVTYGLELVATEDPNASRIRIQTGAGMKALRKYT
ncbi:unnamed protein product [marine sediment metagenome]|uniref:Uncharacterized protein n=1 Tax=marine sediment metagenome TaxID=412755 RepID=X1G367_9ZZZZ